MKKNKLFKVLVTVMVLFTTTTVKAAYNGTGGVTANVPTGSGCTSTTPMCYNGSASEPGYFFLQVRLYYIDNTNGKFEWSDGNGHKDVPVGYNDDCGGTYFFADSVSKKQIVSYGIKSSCVYNMDGQHGEYTWNNALGTDNARYQKMSAMLRNYFGDDINNCEDKICTPNDNLKKFFNGVTNGDWSDTSDAYASVLTLDSQNAVTSARKVSDGATKGYRLIFEPVLIWNYTGTNYKPGLYTPKQAASYGFRNTSSSKPFTGASGQAQYLTTEFSDVGIDYGSQTWCANSATKDDLANWKIGCGMNIIDVGKYVSTHYCYDKSTKNLDGNLVCKNYDKNNEGEFAETYSKKECSAEEDLKDTNTEYGKQIAENNNCTLYCIESAKASLPGGISKPFNLGYDNKPNAYFAWPSRFNSATGMKLYLSSTYNCRVVQKDGKTCSSSDISSMVSSAKSSLKKLEVGAKLTGGNHNPITAQSLVIANDDISSITEKDTSKLSINSEGITEQFSVSRKTYFEIKTTTNRYFNRSTGEVADDGSSWSGVNAFDRGEGVISLGEKKTDAGKDYELKITDIKLGSGNQFGKKIDNYTCKYSVEPDICGECPSDSLHPGDPLYDHLTEGKTCEDIKLTYCYKSCVSKKDGSAIDITTCINNKMASDGLDIQAAARACEKETPDCVKDVDDKCEEADKNEWKTCMNGDKSNYHICYDKLCKRACEKIGSTYYCKDGKSCNKEKYNSECEKNKCEEADETEWNTCMNGDSNNYDYCYEKLCSYEGNRCDRVTKETWDKCIKNGHNYSYCYREYCPSWTCKDCKYHCTTKAGTEVDISKCISDRQLQNGESASVAKSKCSKEYCPSDGNGGNCSGKCKWTQTKSGNTLTYVKTCDGKVCLRYPVYCPNDKCIKSNNVVYRTVDLDNPFPANNKNGVTTQFSNDNRTGRLPSSNWNSKEIVNQDILNARGVKGTKLYTEKTPLYTIVLTPERIKEVRKYNKGKNYSDFRLDCKGSDSATACISNFLHTTIYDAIDRKNSVQNCYNMTKTASGFDSCYNKNN